MNKRTLIILISTFFAAILIATGAFFLFGGESQPVDTESSLSEESLPSDTESEESSEPESSEASSSEPEKITLSVTAPRQDVTVYVDRVTIKGTADPALPLFINDRQIEVSKDGLFAEEMSLSVGNNYFTVKQDENEYKCVVRYRKTVILEVSPKDNLTLDGGATLTVRAKALAGSTVKAAFNGKTITLAERAIEHDDEYAEFFGSFTMPVNYDSNKNYGKVTFTATSKVGNGKANTGSITVRKTELPEEDDGYVMPEGGDYIDVGHTYVAEVISRSAETFYYDDSADFSRPENCYLPKGTVDYCRPGANKMYSGSTVLELRTLRYGKQLYEKDYSGESDIKVYEGTLPETNKLSVASFTGEGRHSVLTLNVDWKAPFNFELLPQKYYNTNTQNGSLSYTISSATYSYVDITFCYASEFVGEIDLTDNRIFSSYEIIENKSDYTLRLYLKSKGKFYGWSAEYNTEGQLVFSFLNPAVLEEADNKYGYSLKGVVIVIDAGHGGSSSGTDGFISSGPNEKELNLLLARQLEERLKSYGATVYMTRSDDSTVDSIDRMNLVRDVKPDYVISIHRNASSSSTPRGFISYHFNAYSAEAAKLIFRETDNKDNLYEDSKWSYVKWHYFFLCRITEAPSVLTENGFLSNKDEYADVCDEEFNERCADAFVDGIFAYFKSIQ